MEDTLVMSSQTLHTSGLQFFLQQWIEQHFSHCWGRKQWIRMGWRREEKRPTAGRELRRFTSALEKLSLQLHALVVTSRLDKCHGLCLGLPLKTA